jgi:hypothetical protein
MTQEDASNNRSNEQTQLWAEQWLQGLRKLPRVITSAEIESLQLLVFSGGQSWGIADGAARIRYLVSSKLVSNVSINDLFQNHLETALRQVIAEGAVASEELALLAPGLQVGMSGQREPTSFDLRRMGLEYKAGFALSQMTIHFCEMHSIKNGSTLLAAIEDKALRVDYLNTLRVLASGRSESTE